MFLRGAEIEHLLRLARCRRSASRRTRRRPRTAAPCSSSAIGPTCPTSTSVPSTSSKGRYGLTSCLTGTVSMMRSKLDGRVRHGLRDQTRRATRSAPSASASVSLSAVRLSTVTSGAHRRRQLDRHMAEAAHADHADAAARTDVPGAQRRVGGDAGAQQRRGLRRDRGRPARSARIPRARRDAWNSRRTSISPVMPVRAVVGAGDAFAAKLLLVPCGTGRNAGSCRPCSRRRP